MIYRHFFQGILTSFLLCAASIDAAPITWVAQNPNNDMNTPSNWNPATIPGSSDSAIFDSKIPGVSKDPTEAATSFSVGTFNFPNAASPFTFHFNNQPLVFNGAGLTGSQTNAAIQMTNTDNSSLSGSILSFGGSSGTSGSANITVTNQATLTGNLSNNTIGTVNSHVHASSPFSINNGGKITASNIGNDSTIGTGNNSTATNVSSQMRFEQTFEAANNVVISATNNGTFNGTSSSQGNYIAYLNDEQFSVANTFQAGNDFTLVAANEGSDTSSGHGGSQVAVINSNSGTTGNQILLGQGASLGDRATLHAVNTGLYSGTNTNGGSNVAGMNQGQITIGDRVSPGTYSFSAGDDFRLSASCSGVDSAQGTGGDAVGLVSSDQIALFTPCALGDRAQIQIDKSGNYSGITSAPYVNVGSCGGAQLYCSSNIEAGDQFTFQISNTGSHSGTGVGADFIGDVIAGQQANFQETLTLGNNALISITNEATHSSGTSSSNTIGSLVNYGKQMLVKELFQAGNNLQLNITNIGNDNSTGAGGSYVGFINNNTADFTASQLHLGGGGRIGDAATVTIRNQGNYSGSNTSGGSSIGVLSGSQLAAAGDFQAGDNFKFTATNTGTSDASGQSNHSIGVIGNTGQVEFDGNCSVGKNATIAVANSGTNHDTTGTDNLIGYVVDCQLRVAGDFSAGKNLNLTASNTEINDGDSSNFVGYVGCSQLTFQESCNLEDGTIIRAYNSGTIVESQIAFNQGFNVLNGKVIIEAINSGTIGFFGIDIIGDNEGGNADIRLTNSSLNVETSLPTFTIGALNGNSTSVVKSLPVLIINTDPTTHAEFSGVIKDFPAMTSSLIKAGSGTQKLSGNNTYTGLTTVQEGTLIINGSVAADVLINPHGTLKGIGTIGGSLTNSGTVSPGESIGTLNVLGNYINNGGTYAVEANGSGESDLINVSGSSILNGGTVSVSSTDGSFLLQQPYTIVSAAGGVSGRYTRAISAAFINPILSYGPNNVYLTIFSDLSRAADSCNQIGVANNLDNLIDPNPQQSLIISAIANSSLTQAQESLETLSGFQYTNDIWLTNLSTRQFLRRLYDPIRSLVSPCYCEGSPCSDWTGWLEVGTGFTRLNGKNAHHLQANSYQVTRGIQKTFCHHLTVGTAGSYIYDHVDEHHAKANRNSEFLAIYGLYRPALFYALADFTYGHSSNNLSRTVGAGNVSYKAHSKPVTNLFACYGEVGVDYRLSCCLIQPFIGVQAGTAKRNHIRENNSSSFGLSINKHEWNSTSTRIGLHATACSVCNCIDASLDIAWNQLLTSDRNTTRARFRGFGEAFQVCGNRLDRSSVDYALTVSTSPYEWINGYLELNGESWRHASAYNILGGFNINW